MGTFRRRLKRIGWSTLDLSRETGIHYQKLYRNTNLDMTDLEEIDRVLTRAERRLLKELQKELSS